MRKVILLLVLTTFYLLPANTYAQEVDLLWHGETYTPPFYKGLPLWSNEARITFSAIPSIPSFNPSSLYYRWVKNGTVLGNLSGVNRRSITLKDSVLSEPIEVRVDVRDGENGPVLATRSLTVTPTPPRLIVVENHPLYGLMLNRALGDEFSLTGQEVTFSAIPLFASVTYRSAPTLSYTWVTNTGDVRGGDNITYRAPEGSSGSSAIRLRMINSRVLVQPPEKSFLVQFGNLDNQPGF